MIVHRAKALYARHARWVPIVFFGLGFVFDTLMLRRIDELRTLVQQAIYLLVSAALIAVELGEFDHEGVAKVSSSGWARLRARVWTYREALLHFLLGTLLNSYTIFYFKSASTITSFIFIFLLVAVLTLNEFKRFGKSQSQVHVAFWSLCLVSYLVSLAPILLGFMGVTPFLVGVGATIGVFWLYYALLRKRLQGHPDVLAKSVRLPFFAVTAVFTFLYFVHAIPPVPLAINYMGVFHSVTKGQGQYELGYTRPSWKFWQHGDQTFLARPGDVINCFVRVYSPARFNDQLQVRWVYWDARHGWLPSDAIPMQITGGREEGFRGVTRKQNYQEGEWRVQIETLDSREIGRIRFTVEKDDSTGERDTKTVIQ